ncbi:MAG TPA: hypothetical protein VGM81_18425 [Burkholderiaceae bacterium]|jgi:hypothetical protein
MTGVFQSLDAARHEQHDGTAACGGWVESSFDLHRGMEVTEDVGFDEFERLRELGPTPQAPINPWTEPSRRRR